MSSTLLSLLPDNPYWCPADFPHMTLCWAGDGDVEDLPGLILNAATIATTSSPFVLRPTGTAVFGSGGEEVSVLLFEPTPRLLAARALVESWSASDYDFSPHVTLGPVGHYQGWPETVVFSRLQLRTTVGFNADWTLTAT